jgi:hypothetical protein
VTAFSGFGCGFLVDPITPGASNQHHGTDGTRVTEPIFFGDRRTHGEAHDDDLATPKAGGELMVQVRQGGHRIGFTMWRRFGLTVSGAVHRQRSPAQKVERTDNGRPFGDTARPAMDQDTDRAMIGPREFIGESNLTYVS